MLAFPMPLDELQVFPLPVLNDPCRAQGSLCVHSLASDFEEGPINDEIRDRFGNEPIQLPDRLFLDLLVHRGHLGRADLLSPRKPGDSAFLRSGQTPQRHQRDNLIYPVILLSVTGKDGPVTVNGVSVQGEFQSLNETHCGNLDDMGSAHRNLLQCKP